jgi:hypothetical protein
MWEAKCAARARRQRCCSAARCLSRATPTALSRSCCAPTSPTRAATAGGRTAGGCTSAGAALARQLNWDRHTSSANGGAAGSLWHGHQQAAPLGLCMEPCDCGPVPATREHVSFALCTRLRWPAPSTTGCAHHRTPRPAAGAAPATWARAGSRARPRAASARRSAVRSRRTPASPCAPPPGACAAATRGRAAAIGWSQGAASQSRRRL